MHHIQRRSARRILLYKSHHEPDCHYRRQDIEPFTSFFFFFPSMRKVILRKTRKEIASNTRDHAD